MDVTPASDPDWSGVKHYYIGLEQEFDCSETNCAFHNTWYFHFRRIDLTEETIQGSYDAGCLNLDFEAWIRSFLDLRFPSIDFDYQSLLTGESMPHLRLHYTY